MRPGGERPPLGLRLFTVVMFLHWIVAGLDRGQRVIATCPYAYVRHPIVVAR
jgi:hypothetical protein